jgi:GNAT superfamily N-acetyltransferase
VGVRAVSWRVRQADSKDLEGVSSVLQEAAHWLEQRGMALWRDDELSSQRVQEEIASGLFYLAEDDGAIGGVIRFQLDDPEFWPDVLPGEAAYIHRLAVRRCYAGGRVSFQLLDWAVAETRKISRTYLRMDVETPRRRLREIYEKYGFQYHSERNVGPYSVSRYQYLVGAIRQK